MTAFSQPFACHSAQRPMAGVWRNTWSCLGTLILAWAMVCVGATPARADTHQHPLVVEFALDGAVNPASADDLVRGIREAQARDATAVLLSMDTPGGLASSMRDIIKAILNSPVPVIGYVAPRGARAASAGTYILLATHVAAMAPATNVGAATPVSITGGGMLPSTKKDPTESEASPRVSNAETHKIANDSVAYIRALAEQRGRNADWAEQAVREAVSVSAEQALKLHIIDLIAPDTTALLAALDGREVTTAAGTRVLHTANAQIETIVTSARSQFLRVIANPSVALILLLMGLGGLVMEATNPGVIVPGVVGAISLLLALYAFQLLPVNFAGLGLIVLGVVMMVAEAFVPAYGALGMGGVISLVVGSIILMRAGSPAWGVAWPTIAGIALAGAGIIAGIIWLAVRSHRHPVVSGAEELIGAAGQVVADFADRGMVHVHGERWQAQSATPLTQGQLVVVTARHGLTLTVRPANPTKEIPS